MWPVSHDRLDQIGDPMSVSVPSLRGPIEITPTSRPYAGWLGDDDGLEAEATRRGYALEEYVVSGTVDGGEYRTSMVIRRPVDPSRFSGLVLMETLHGLGHGVAWSACWEQLVAGGHGYALVMSQKTGLETLVQPANPQRYADLAIPAPATPYTGDGGFAPSMLALMGPELGEMARVSVIVYSGTSYDILSQAGALVKADDALFGAPVRKLVTAGGSQTGHHTVGFLREAHASAVLDDGRFVFDGYLSLGASADEPFAPAGVPIMLVLSEGEMSPGAPYRREDSDEGGDQFRLYEIAGSAHIPTRGTSGMTLGDIVTGMTPELQAQLPTLDATTAVSQFPSDLVKKALFAAFLDWVGTKVPPPRADRIALNADGDVLRDEHGNALGGVRSSYLDVPVARYTGGSIGFQEPFGSAELTALYGDETGYLSRVEAALERLVAERFLLSDGAAELLDEAKAFSFR